MNENIDKKPKFLPPFRKFCMTVGELPTSYAETMSYYEMLLWFTKYLGETVIPAINNNAEALKEVQDLFVELQEYVNNYFDNLDVQDEINNKLDDMADSGQLAEIINEEIFGELSNKVDQNTSDISDLTTTVNTNKQLTYQEPYYNILENDGYDDGSTPNDTILNTAKTNGFKKFYFPQNDSQDAVYLFTNQPAFNDCEIITDSNVVISVPNCYTTNTGIYNTNVKFYFRDQEEYIVQPKNKPDMFNMLHINTDYRMKNIYSYYPLANIKMYHYDYGNTFKFSEVTPSSYYAESGLFLSRLASSTNNYFNGLCVPINTLHNCIQTVTQGNNSQPRYVVLNATTGDGIYAQYTGSNITVYYQSNASTDLSPLNISKHVFSGNATNNWTNPASYKMRYNKDKNTIDFIFNNWIVATYTLPFTPTYWGFGLPENSTTKTMMRFTQYYQENLPMNYKLKVLIVGDSRFAGVGQTYKIDEVLKNGLLYNGVNNVEIDNLAVNGYSVNQIYDQLSSLTLTNYDVIVYQGGINNYQSNLEDIAVKLGQTTNLLKSSGAIVIYTTCMPCGYGGSDPVANQRALAYYGIVNAMYVGIGSYPSDNIVVLDNNMGNEKYESNIPVCSDGVHPNDNGIIEIARNIIAGIFNYFK